MEALYHFQKSYQEKQTLAQQNTKTFADTIIDAIHLLEVSNTILIPCGNKPGKKSHTGLENNLGSNVC